jgi:hypothetical protein
MPKKHAMKANAGAGFCSMTGRYVSLSHAATAPPPEFRISFWLPLGEGRLTTLWVPRCGIRGCSAQDSCLPRGDAVWYCERLVPPGKRGRGRCCHRIRTAQSAMHPCGSERCHPPGRGGRGRSNNPSVTFDIEMIGWVDTERNKICHASCEVCFAIPNKRS